MKRESIIKMLILSAVVAGSGATPNLEANAATLINDNAKNISSDVKSGWINKDGKRYYVKPNGEVAKYLQTIDGKTYYFNGSGEMVTGWLRYVDNNEWHYFGQDGSMQKGWLTLGDKKYYLNDKGARVNYLQIIGGKTYYFNGSGEMVTGWLRYVDNNEWHYFGQDGSMQKGWLTLGDKKYYLNDKGARVTGNIKIDNKEYNFDKNGILIESNQGWVTRDGKRYYVKPNGEVAKYLQTIDGKTYYFNGSGEMVTGWLRYLDNNEWHYFGQDGSMQKGWITLGGKRYYLNDKGARVNYLQIIGGKTYYFNGSGEMVTGWLRYLDNNEWHYFGQDGSMQKGWLTLGDKKYYLNDKGARVTGNIKIDNKEYNFDKNGILIESNQGWVTRDGKRYYVKPNGEVAKYLQTIDGKTYYFNGSGEMVTGWLRYLDNNEWHYFGQDGSMQKGWITLGGKRYYLNDKGARVNYLQIIGGKTYYFNGSGEMVTGWLRYLDNNEWHYFGQDGSMQKGWLTLGGKKYYLNDKGARVNYLQTIDGETYYFTSNGEMVSGWVKYVDNNEWHYFDQDGSMHKGWLTLDGKKYYFNDKGARVNYLQTIDGKTYYFTGNGEMVSGWVKYVDNNEWHYFDQDGSMHKGWLTLDGKKYYFNEVGARVTGQVEIDGEMYEFNNDGVLKDNPFGEGKITDYTMNLRSEPSLNSEVLTTMPPNSKVQILGKVKGDLTYYHVKYVNNGHTYYGYVSIYLNGNTAVQVYDDNRADDYLGVLSEKYESNGDPGSVSSGEGDYGGKSYGAWQLSSNMGSLGGFINWLSGKNDSFYKELTNARKLDNGSYDKHFDDAWRDIAKNHYNEFYNLQHEYTKITFYDDLIKRLKNSGDYTSVLNNFAAKNVLWSTAVQHGGYGAYKIIAPLTHTTNVEDFITSVYKERGRRDSDGNLVYFRSSSKAVQEGVASRYVREREDAIRMYRDSL